MAQNSRKRQYPPEAELVSDAKFQERSKKMKIKKYPLDLAIIESFSINWLGKTRSGQNFLHTIFKITIIVFFNRTILREKTITWNKPKTNNSCNCFTGVNLKGVFYYTWKYLEYKC